MSLGRRSVRLRALFAQQVAAQFKSLSCVESVKHDLSLSYRFQVTLRGEACAVIRRSFEGMSRLDHALSIAAFSASVRFDGERPIASATNVSHAGVKG
jgi:hypothetical protein